MIFTVYCHGDCLMTKKSKLYFENEAVTKAILLYQQGLKHGRDDIHLIYPYTEQLQALVKGVINTHKLYRWWNDTDELVQEGVMAIMIAIKRFNPKYGTAFNYLSIVAKQHLKNWTQSRNKKNWVTDELNEEIYQDETNSDSMYVIEDIFASIEVSEKLAPVLDDISRIIIEEKIFNKRDIVSHLVKNGRSKSDITAVFAVLKDRYND